MINLNTYITEKFKIDKNIKSLPDDEEILDIIKATVLSIAVLDSTNSYMKFVNWYEGTDWDYLKKHYDFIADVLNKRFGYRYGPKDYNRGGIIPKTINTHKPPINKLIRDKETVEVELPTRTVKIDYLKDIFQCKEYKEIKKRYKDWFDIDVNKDGYPKKGGKIPTIVENK